MGPFTYCMILQRRRSVKIGQEFWILNLQFWFSQHDFRYGHDVCTKSFYFAFHSTNSFAILIQIKFLEWKGYEKHKWVYFRWVQLIFTAAQKQPVTYFTISHIAEYLRISECAQVHIKKSNRNWMYIVSHDPTNTMGRGNWIILDRVHISSWHRR